MRTLTIPSSLLDVNISETKVDNDHRVAGNVPEKEFEQMDKAFRVVSKPYEEGIVPIVHAQKHRVTYSLL